MRVRVESIKLIPSLQAVTDKRTGPIPERWLTYKPYDGEAPKSNDHSDVNDYFVSRIFHLKLLPSTKDDLLGFCRRVWQNWGVDVSRSNKITQLFLENPSQGFIKSTAARLLARLSVLYSVKLMPAVIFRLYARLKAIRNQQSVDNRQTHLDSGDCLTLYKMHSGKAFYIFPNEEWLTLNDLPARFAAGWENSITPNHCYFGTLRPLTTGTKRKRAVEDNGDDANAKEGAVSPPSLQRLSLDPNNLPGLAYHGPIYRGLTDPDA